MTENKKFFTFQRGMVTVEMAFGILVLATILALLIGGISLAGIQSKCHDSAAMIARQLARGDEPAAQQLLSEAPQHTTMNISREDDKVRVDLRCPARFAVLPPFDVVAHAVSYR